MADRAAGGGRGHRGAGNLFPRKISFLPGMRYYAGNWDTSLWCIKPSADAKIAAGRRRDRQHVAAAQLEKFYGSKEAAQIPIATWDMRSAPSTLTVVRCSPWRTAAMAGHNEDDYTLTDGERMVSDRPSGGTSATAT